MPCQLSKNCRTLKMEAPHCYETLVTISRHIITSQKIWSFINTQLSHETHLNISATTYSEPHWMIGGTSQWWTPQGRPQRHGTQHRIMKFLSANYCSPGN